MATVFKKLAPNNPISTTIGKSLRFEDFGNNIGFLVTDDPIIIAEFQACMKAGRGGLSESTMEEYQAAIKKKQNSPALRASSFREVQTAGLVTLVIPQVEVAESAAVAAPIDVAAESAKPAKLPDVKVGKRVEK